MKTVMIVIGAVILAGITLMLYACCRVSGIFAREEEIKYGY